jgi:hypothetical protein
MNLRPSKIENTRNYCNALTSKEMLVDLYSAFLLQVRSSLAMSSLSAVFAIMGFIILCVNLSSLGSASQLCDLSKLAQPTTYYSYDYYHNRYARGCLIATASLNVSISPNFVSL